MATEVVPPFRREIRGYGTNGVGAAATTTVDCRALWPGTRRISLAGFNYAGGAIAIAVAMNPYIAVLKTLDNFKTPGQDLSEAAQDSTTATILDLSSLTTLANGGAIWVGSHVPIRGLHVDVQAANSNASVLTGTYYAGTGSMVNIGLTDGTDSAGATFGVDGDITWTVPATGAAGAWQIETLNNILKRTNNRAQVDGEDFPGEVYNMPLYWVRLVVSAALDSSTTVNAALPLSRSTNYLGIYSGMPPFESRVNRHLGGVGSVEFRTDAGTANLAILTDSMDGVFAP